MRFEVVKGETEHITLTGRRVRNPTVLIRVGKVTVSKRALLLGLTLFVCQCFDGILTYLGLTLMGVDMEGNVFLRELMMAYGKAPTLVVIKLGAVGLVVLLTFHAHRRRWIRPIIVGLVAVYLTLAVAPWTYIIAQHHKAAASNSEQVPR